MNRTTTNLKMPVSAGLHNISPKAMAATVLVGLMVILWGRVLLKGEGGPESAGAEEMPNQLAAAGVEQPAMQVYAVEIPFIAGRNDKLSCDVFSSKDWTAFNFNDDGVSQVENTVPDDDKAVEKRHLDNLDAISKELKLEAVIQGVNGGGMQAFIGDKILTVGQVITVNHGSDVYDLTLTDIAPQQASLTWKAYSIRLKITESQEQ